MVRYLDDDHIFVTMDGLISSRIDGTYRDPTTGKIFYSLRFDTEDDPSPYLVDFARLLRNKNFPGFVGILPRDEPTVDAIVQSEIRPRTREMGYYLRDLFALHFPIAPTPTLYDRFNGISCNVPFVARKIRTIPLFDQEGSPAFREFAQNALRGGISYTEVSIDLTSLHDFFTDDDWEQLCFGLFALSVDVPITFEISNSTRYTDSNPELYRVDRNLAHFHVKPTGLRSFSPATTEEKRRKWLNDFEVIREWMAKFAQEVLLFREQELLEIESAPESLVGTVLGVAREETALQRNKLFW